MDEKEFRIRVVPLQRLMYSMALKSGMPPDDAADALQETLLRLWRSRDSIPDDPPALRAYCLTTLRNECVTVIRKRRDADPLDKAIAFKAPPESETAESRDTLNRIETLMDTLPESQRQVVRMSSFGEFSITEISEATGFTPGNVRQLLSRARKRLRQMIEL